MADSIFSTTQTTSSPASAPSIFSGSPKPISASITPTPSQSPSTSANPSPAVQNAVEDLFSKIDGDIKTGAQDLVSNFTKPAINIKDGNINYSHGVNPNALQAPLISSPFTSDQMDQKVSDMNNRVTQLVNSKNSLDLTNENSVNQYNTQADQIRKDSEDLGNQVQTYNLSQKVHQIISTPTGYGSLGPTEEQQLEKGVNLALMAGGVTSGATEFALAAKSDLIPMVLKGSTNLASGLGIFTGIDKALAGVKANASDSNKLLLYLGELAATGGILNTLNDVTPKLGDKLFQSVSETYNLPKTIYFNPSEVVKTLGGGEMSDLARALSSENGGLDVQKVRDAYKNGVSIEIPASKITTIAEKPFWTKIKSAFGIDPIVKESLDTLGSPKVGPESRSSRLLSAPTTEDIQQIADNIKSGKPAIESTTPTVKIPKSDISDIGLKFNQKATPEETLNQEAKKYSSPQEFENAIQYHGLSDGGHEDILKNGFRPANEGVFTASKDEASEYGEAVPVLVKQGAQNLETSLDGKVPITGTSYKSEDVIPLPKDFNATEFYNKAHGISTPEGRKTLPERPAEPERITTYKERLKLRGADPVLVDAIITPKGNRAYGVSVGGQISLEKTVEHLTEDHEVFHQVFQNMEKMRLFKNFDKGALLDEAKDLYGDLPAAQLEEEIAKDFQQYVNERETGKQSSFFGKVGEFFQRLLSSLKRLFRNQNDINEFYRTTYEDKATEPTEINDEMPAQFNQQVKDGVLDFRIQNSVANFLDEVPVKDAFTDSGDLTLKTIQKLQGRTTVSKQYIYDLTNSGNIKQVERDLIRSVLDSLPDDQKVDVAQFAQDVKDELLPLTTTNGVSPRYENITLPQETRGNVADYKENIYESPIKTSAGSTHFSGKGADNYFGHTRIEEMADDYMPGKKVVRQIENQSDLYQKGNLEKDFANARGPANEQSIKYWQDQLKENPDDQEAKDQLGFSLDAKKLSQYNDPTAHFRLVREDIKRFAQQGFNTALFPTGETAMKIEGLGYTNNWFLDPYEPEESADPIENVRPKDLKIGNQIYQHNSPWIITDVLGDGKFKAVTKNTIDIAKKQSRVQKDGTEVKTDEDAVRWLRENNSVAQETFDISGKVDTSNPIYRFYEKDLGRYLKNNYNAVPVTDDKGVTWMEVPIQKAYGDLPVPAFNERKETQTVEQLQNQRERFKQSLEAYKENPQAHMQAYGEDKSQSYKDKIEELTKRIQEIKNPVFNLGNKLDDLRAVLKNVEERTGATPIQPQIQKLQEKLKAITPDADIPKINVSGKDIQLPENLARRQLSLEIDREQLNNSPYKGLLPYVAKSGDFKDQLPEVLGKKPTELKGTSYSKIKSPNVLKFIQQGDEIIQSLFGQNTDTEDVRAGMEDYLKRIADAKSESTQLRKDISGYIKEEKDNIALDRISLKDLTDQEKKDMKIKEAESLANWKSLFTTYAQEAGLPQSISEVEPPTARGGIKSPELNFTKWKDGSTPGLARDTFERNLEKVAPKGDADQLKKFIVDPVRENELKRTEFNNKLKLDTREKVKELGIRRNSIADDLVQKWGEGLISEEELKSLASKKYQEIQKASEYFRNQYDMLINKWNDVRKEFGYPEIPKRKDYFRHFDDINFFTKTYGFLNSQDELPTEIAGKTEFFKPGKTFSTAELKRTGKSTSYSAIGGFNNYIDSVSKQIFHIDSIQRGRALEKYIDKSAETGRRLDEPLKLSNFVANLREYVNNGLAGKTATLDRAIEGSLGRPALQVFDRVSKLIGKNIIVGNISTALSHLVSLPLIGATTDKIPLTKGLMTTLTSPFRSEPFNTIDGQKSSYLTRRFPIEEITSTIPKTIENALSYLFTVTDKFKSRLAISGKYYEGIRDGLDPGEAMKVADTYAGKVLGDYSLGQKPNLMNSKTLGLLAQFQLGVNDSMSVLFHDIPESEKVEKEDAYGNKYQTTKKWSVLSKVIQFAIFSYLFNQVIKNIRGSGKGLDPIDLGLTLSGLNDEGAGQSFPKRAGLAATDALGELPFTSALTGNFPLASAISDPVKDLLAGNYAKAAEAVAADFASPVGGGLQAKKTIEGAQAINKGESVGTGQNIKSLIFGAGSSATPDSVVSNSLNTKEKTAETKLGEFNPTIVAKVQGVFDQVKAAGFDSDEAQSLVDGLSDNEYKVYQAVKTVDKAKDTIDLESTVLPIVQKASLLGFDTPEAAQYVSDSFPDTPEGDKEYDAYTSIKSSLFGANAPGEASSGPSDDGGWDKQSFVTHIANIAKATAEDPVTMFNNIFAGNSSWKVVGFKNGQVIVQRMDEKTSETIKKKEGGQNAEYKLDHSVPLTAGGNNGSDNLQLIPTDQWATNTPIEDYLGKALGDNKITGAQAREYAIRFKAGIGEILSPALQKEYKDKYNSQPITFDQIKQDVVQ